MEPTNERPVYADRGLDLSIAMFKALQIRIGGDFQRDVWKQLDSRWMEASASSAEDRRSAEIARLAFIEAWPRLTGGPAPCD